jgi:hypothetical protein
MSLTKGTPASSQIITLERMLQERDAEIADLRMELDAANEENSRIAHHAAEVKRENAALRAQAQGEPVAYRYKVIDCFGNPVWTWYLNAGRDQKVLETQALYAHPAPASAEVERDAVSLDFLAPMYRWLARAHFSREKDEWTAAMFGEQIRAAIAATQKDGA